jgi:hypothetical protein
MVTGVETAGLILGAIPLLISAIEHYEEAVEPTVAFFQWKGQLSTAVRELYMGRTTYHQTIQLLLRPVTSKQILKELMDDPKSHLWRDPGLENKLRDKLGIAYDPCMLTIREIEEIMINVAENLNIDGAHKVY